MSANSNNNSQNKKNNQTKKPAAEQTVDVLYQKLGDRWFAFSIINDEVFMSPISDDQLSDIRREEALNSLVNVSFNDSGNTNEAA